jgi:ketosteroid isomerase-like protein
MGKNTTEKTLAVLGHHMQALLGGDLEAIVADYAEESILFTPDGPLRGLEGVRAFFAGILETTPPEMMAAFEMVRQDGEGEVAYIVWHAPGFIPLGTDTFIVRDGKIVVQSFATYAPPPGP